MKRSQILIAAIAAVTVGIVAAISLGGGGSDKKDGSAKVEHAPSGAVTVSFAYSPEKEKLFKPAIAKFNSQRKTVDGKQVFVEGQVIASGEAETKIAKGTLKPVAWSPSSSLWGRLLNFEADQPYIAADNPSIVRTPLVIAMWEPFAKALGWPKKQIGFDELTKLAVNKQGFAAYGKPEYGQFKLVHTNPDFSTAGLSAVVAEYYAATGKKEGLTEKDVTASKARKQVQDIERSIVHYGDTTLFVADQLRKHGPGYASAVALEEATLVDFNRHRGHQPKLVALYPPEGTFYSDDPFLMLNAPWVSSAQKQGADQFEKFLTKNIDAEQAGKYGFRPGDLHAKPSGLVTPENGADPKLPTRVLGLPEPRVLASVKKTWRADRKPANVLLVVDVSGSMNDENRLERAKSGLDSFLRQLSPNDHVGMTIFSDQIQKLVPVGANRDQVRGLVHRLIADGGTAAFDATAGGIDDVRKLHDKSRINAVVVLTDGEDTDSNLSVDDVVRKAAAQGDSRNQVRVFTIAYSASASGAADNLERISKASDGQAYTGDTDDIETVYRSISSFF
jgi:Ca-activated chloride channel family protein